MPEGSAFLAGVIEGFYGPPWDQSERIELLEEMVRLGLNTYLYAPKDDLKHRLLWREPYDLDESQTLRELISQCHQRGLRFFYALSPGLDVRYSDRNDVGLMQAKLKQMVALGCRHFALLFDDIPDHMDPEDRCRYDSFATAQCQLANHIFDDLQPQSAESRFLFCPTPYCGRMAMRGLGGAGYLQTIGRELAPQIDIFWTGSEIISSKIEVAEIQRLAQVLRRKPLLWDNLYANDYDGRRFFCGPYCGRPPALRQEVSGILLNPNCEYPLNYVPLHTFAQYLQSEVTWEAREAYLAAMAAWLPRFASPVAKITLEELVLLGDCFYLPHQEGPTAEALFEAAQQLMCDSPVDWELRVDHFERLARQLHKACAQIANLRDRHLFAALSRRTWELREELDLFAAFIAAHQAGSQAVCSSDAHLPKTYRGGLVPRLQRLLRQHPDGTFTPAEEGVP